MSKKPHKKRHFIRGALCSIFAVASFGGGVNLLYRAYQDTRDPALDTDQPCVMVDEMSDALPPAETIDVFGAEADHTSFDPGNYYYSLWQQVLENQSRLLNSDTARAQSYADFLRHYDQYRDECIAKMADNVNDDVLDYVTYTSDDDLYDRSDYWAAPAETVASERGDCEDYAILQYAILRHLGVPDNRLMITLVDAKRNDQGLDHAVLLLNIAPDGATPEYAVLNDGGPVTQDTDYEPGGPRVPRWHDPYFFYYALNDGDFWYPLQAAQARAQAGAPAPLPPAPSAPKPA